MSEPAAPTPLARRWPWRVLAAFVTGTLIALVLIPVRVQRRVDNLREISRAGEPARTIVRQWQSELVQQYVVLSELAVSDDSALAAAYADARVAEAARDDQLEPYAAKLGPGVRSAFDRARQLIDEWHEEVDLIGGGTGRSVLDIERQDHRFTALVDAVTQLDDAILRATASGRAQIYAAERQALMWTVLLGVFAVISAIAVIVLEERVRGYAMEAVRRRAEADRAVAASSRAAEARASLIRGITHDVKNPLGTAKGYAELLEIGVKGDLDNQQLPLVEGVQRSIDHALAIIGDLLHIAGADGGGVRVQPVEVNLTDLVHGAADDHAASARTSGHEIAVETPASPLTLETDPARVRQVLDNLLSNAIKYTPPPGHITLRAERVRDDGAPGPGPWYAITVSNTGPGISAEYRDAIFDEFTRVPKDSATEGHGLGLPVARGLARRLGGDLTLADTSPGATFVFWIPEDAERIRKPGPDENAEDG